MRLRPSTEASRYYLYRAFSESKEPGQMKVDVLDDSLNAPVLFSDSSSCSATV